MLWLFPQKLLLFVKKDRRLTSFLHLQLSFGLLQDGLDGLIGTRLWSADAGRDVTCTRRQQKDNTGGWAVKKEDIVSQEKTRLTVMGPTGMSSIYTTSRQNK